MTNNTIRDSELISRTLYQEMDKFEKIEEKEVRHLYGEEFVEGTSFIKQLEETYDDLFKMNQLYNVWNTVDSIYRTKLDSISYQDIKKYQHIIKKAQCVLGKRYHLKDSKEMVEVFNKYFSAKKNLGIDEDGFLVSEIYLEEIFNYLNELMQVLTNYYQNYVRKISSTAYTKFMPKERLYASNELRNKIFLGHIYLAKIYASKYYKELRREVPYDDLFQTASMGLLNACHYYSVDDKRAKFTTYASKCIDNMLRRTYVNLRKKKRHSFEQERFNISLAEGFVNSIFKYDKYHHDYFVSSYFVNRVTREFNKACSELGKQKYLGNTVSRLDKEVAKRTDKEEKQRLENVYTDILKMVSHSKLNLLIDDDEREMINLLFNRRNFNKKTKDVYLLKEYLKLYREKLGDIALYLNVEKELTEKLDGEIPTNDEILKEMNNRIRKYNRSSSYFGSIKSYYDQYLETYKVDIFSDKEEEKDKILNEYEDIIFNIDIVKDYYRRVLDDIDDATKNNEELYVSIQKDDFVENKYSFKLVTEAENNLSLVEAKNFIEKEITNIDLNTIDEDEYLKNVLNERKKYINEQLSIYNDPIIKHNQAIKEDVYQSSLGYHRKPYKMGMLEEIIDDTELLYSDNIEFLDYIANNPRTKRARQNLEEEVATKIFMEDYYKALEELSELEKLVMYYWYDEEGIHNYSAKMIAEHLSIRPSEVKKARDKAIRKLQKNKKLSSYLNY